MHTSVLLNETIEALNIKEDGIYVDMTLGYGGHSSQILKRLKNGFLYAFDQDEEAIKYASKRLSEISNNFEIIHSNFSNIKEELTKRGITKVDGIIYDLGVSSPQLDNDYRGFSYHNDAKLDMRMDLNTSLTAYEVVNTYSFNDLVRIISTYGEEKYALSIARNIEKYRSNKDIKTTLELVEIIKSSMPEKAKRDKHPARKTFQAIRIEVNNELEVLKKSLNDSLALLNNKGRICVITFQSLEDRIVKKLFKSLTEEDKVLKGMPNIPQDKLAKYQLLGKITPSKKELEENNRSRSAILRIIERK